MIQAAPTHRDLLRLNRSLPDELRDSSVVVQFAAPVPSRRLANFHYVHLSPPMLAGGESTFWQPQIRQPHRIGRQVCLTCRGELWRVGEADYRCINPRCRQDNGRPTSELIQGIRPHRGVVAVRDTFKAQHRGQLRTIEFVVGCETVTMAGGVKRSDPLVAGCLLVLDRRYHDAVLCAVARTANDVCHLMGWRTL